MIGLSAFKKEEWFALYGAFIWAYIVSDYCRNALSRLGSDNSEAEAMIAFGLWGLILCWISKRYSGGWSAYWFAFAIASFAPFADSIDAAFGGLLGLRE